MSRACRVCGARPLAGAQPNGCKATKFVGLIDFMDFEADGLGGR